MEIKKYNAATPIIEELERLNNLILPNVHRNDNRDDVNVIEKNDNSTGISFCFTRNDNGNYNPLLRNGENEILLHEHEYNDIKQIIDKIIDNRIKIQKRNLDAI